MNRQKYLEEIDRVIKAGPFNDTWDSLGAFEAPKWYRDAKFGIFIHWGIFSVPAFHSEWYSRNMYIQGSDEFKHHVETYGPHKDFGYKDFIPMFKAEKFDADEWAAIFKDAGARYVVPVAEHHDGFQMYKSEVSHFNAFEMGPKRDVLGELEAAFEKKGLITGASSHRVEHWFFMGHGKEFDSDIHEPMELGDFYWPAKPEGDHFDLYSEPVPTKEFLDDWLIRTCEIIDKFKPGILYFDWWIQHSSVKPYIKKLAAYYYNKAEAWGKKVAICYKHDAFAFGTAVVDVERGQFAEMKPFFWQTDTAIARNSWCYTTNLDYKEPKEIIQALSDIVSKNGALLLNVGPKADGTIPDEDKRILGTIGQWLRVNGEAIYNTHIWRTYGEGPTKTLEGQFTDGKPTEYTEQDFRFTSKGGSLYAIAMNYNSGSEITIKTLGIYNISTAPVFFGIIEDIKILGSDEKVIFTRDDKGLHIAPLSLQSNLPVVFKIIMA